MKRYITALTSAVILLPALLLMGACHEIDEYSNDYKGNFDQLWKIMDEHYCFFEQKGVNWNDMKVKYGMQVTSKTTTKGLFRIMAAMLDELKDGHVNLSSPFETSYYRNWWSDYPQNYNERLVQENYLHFNYISLGPVYYYTLPQNIGYLRIPSFEHNLGDGNIDNILANFATASALIIDIRDNGGGNLNIADNYISHFIGETITAGYIAHKTGPGHNDFSSPREITVSPVAKPHYIWGKPVIVLTNRSTFSAANYFTAVMKSLPHVTIAGATTGGGAGVPFSSELSCGWGVRFSACPVTGPDGKLTEFGVEPTPGCAIDMDPLDEFSGKDTILEFAIGRLTTP
ncbi:MAG: S41 family peptidase [Muribaculaceae bacterium]|nr:S41 family peptidase [Muribaculaceae bacterium]